MQDSVKGRIESILRDQTHGAAFLAREALATMRLGASTSKAKNGESFVRDMAKLGSRLISLRPSMAAPIANGTVRMFSRVIEAARDQVAVDELKRSSCDAADTLLKVAEEISRETVRQAIGRISENTTIITHSYSETCSRILLGCVKKGIRVFATESRPLYEGRKTATILQQGGIDVTLITDAEAGYFMPEAQMVLVGADTILADGSVVNKMGTYLIALAAMEEQAAFYVAADSWKIRLESGGPELEEKNPAEVLDTDAEIPVKNVCFDITPAKLIKSFLTEDGAVAPEAAKSMGEKWRKVLRGMREIAGGE